LSGITELARAGIYGQREAVRGLLHAR